MAKILSNAGLFPIVALISPNRAARDGVKALFDGFCEVYLDVPVDVCAMRRDIYSKLLPDQINGQYEPPLNPSMTNPSADEMLLFIV